jgi:hypothetical protein
VRSTLQTAEVMKESEKLLASEKEAEEKISNAAQIAAKVSSEAFAKKVVREIFKLGKKAGVEGSVQGMVGGDKYYGKQEDVVTLIRQNGVFRGVTLMEGASDMAHRRVVQFKPAPLSLPDIEKQKAMVFNSDIASMEGSISSTRLQCLSKTDRAINMYGISAFGWPALGVALTGCSPPTSTGLNFGNLETEETQQEMAAGETHSESELNEKGRQFAKTMYTLEPRAIFNINPNDLEPTPDFITDVNHLTVDSGNPSIPKSLGQFTIQDLFNKYGTHSCVKVTLGGWWRSSADFKSSEMLTVWNMTKAVSNALDKARAKRETEGHGASAEQAFYHSGDIGITEVHDSWKGGISGGTAEEFRKSLGGIGDYGVCSENGNWRIIDRNLDQCRGIWSFVPSTHLRLAICEEWAKKIIHKMGIGDVSETAMTAACGTGLGTVEEFRESLASFKLKPLPKRNAVCLTYTCPLAYEVKPGTDLLHCTTEECGLTDLATCCQKINETAPATPAPAAATAPAPAETADSQDSLSGTSVFRLTVKTENTAGCNTDAKVYGLVDDQTDLTASFTAAQSGDKTTKWQQLQNVNGDDTFELGSSDTFILPDNNGANFIPKRVCLMTASSWCPSSADDAVSVSNANKVESDATGAFGTAHGYAKFSSPKPQCALINQST